MKPRLVKNVKMIKLAHVPGGVKGTLKRAMDAAREQGWKRVVIVGESSTNGRVLWSGVNDSTTIGMCERAKHVMLNDY